MIRLALPRGRLLQETVDLLTSKGVLKEKVEEGRKLTLEVGNVKVFLVKPFDVPIYVEKGVADIGVCGMDVLMELKPEVYKLLDLGIGACRISVAGKPEAREVYLRSSYVKVATKYPNVAKEFFRSKGIKAEVLTLSGSVELAPLIGLSDLIVDLVQTGRTLKENGLVEIEEIARSTAWIICNRASFRNRRQEVLEVINRIL